MQAFERIREMGNAIASAGWSTATDMRRLAARVGVISQTELSARVISIGNLEAGGTGKTPLCMDLANRLIEQGKQTVLLTRGYRGQWEKEGGIVSPDDGVLDPQKVGDEVALLHQFVKNLWIGVGANRAKQFKKLKERIQSPIQFVLLDDGFQNVQLKKNIEVVVLSATSWGRTVFRDRLSRLKKADFICTRDPKVYEDIRADYPKVGLFEYQLPAPEHDHYIMVSGVGNGKQVLEKFRQSGYSISHHFDYSDHYVYSKKLIDDLLSISKKEGAKILMTGKDGIKWRFLLREQKELSDRFVDIEPRVHWVHGREYWESVET